MENWERKVSPRDKIYWEEKLMNFEKIKEILKSRKVQLMAGTVAGALVIALSGTMILNNNIENKSVAVEKNTEKENKVEDKKESTQEDKANEVKESKEELEELKKIDTSNLSDEEKKELENKIADIESKIESVQSNKEVASTTSNSTSSKNDVVQNNNDNKVQSNTISNNKVENNSTTTNNSTNSNITSNNSTSNNTTESKPNNNVNNNTTTNDKHEHTHNWVPITTIVHHDEEGHWENVLVSAAWTEEVPVYETQARDICNDCGADLTDMSEADFMDHIFTHVENGGKGSWSTKWIEVQVGTNKINHEAVYEKKWVVDKASWDETVTTGYKCSICGEVK